ncbi:hypothetical protein ACIBJC_00640 [Streptomyces sp. NPDC050509]|uniref:hypothetical protein n=1 Tax=Streptomyces sp. NPDC050509 TaxID=3365620 RepID=UPI0037AB9ED9
MTVAVVPAQPRLLDRRPDGDLVVAAWSEWLRGELDPGWRPGEWNADVLLFVGDPHNPRTSVAVCRIATCGATILNPGYCKPCRDAYRESGLTEEKFEATYTRTFRRVAAHRSLATCAVLSAYSPLHIREYADSTSCKRSWTTDRRTPQPCTTRCRRR